mgnify:CR=1 FL=1
MSLRLTRNLRVFKPFDYKAIFNHGKITIGRYWQVIARKINVPTPRLGLVISKKVHRLAVDRNRVKRIARETFRTHQHDLNHWEFVVMAKHSKSAKNSIMTHDLLHLFKKITTH